MKLKALLLVGVNAWMIGCNNAQVSSPPEEPIQTATENAAAGDESETQNAGESIANTAQRPDHTNQTDGSFELNTENSSNNVQLDDLPISLVPPQNPVQSSGSGSE